MKIRIAKIIFILCFSYSEYTFLISKKCLSVPEKIVKMICEFSELFNEKLRRRLKAQRLVMRRMCSRLRARLAGRPGLQARPRLGQQS